MAILLFGNLCAALMTVGLLVGTLRFKRHLG
jgi:hypothetical protein